MDKLNRYGLPETFIPCQQCGTPVPSPFRLCAGCNREAKKNKTGGTSKWQN